VGVLKDVKPRPLPGLGDLSNASTEWLSLAILVRLPPEVPTREINNTMTNYGMILAWNTSTPYMKIDTKMVINNWLFMHCKFTGSIQKIHYENCHDTYSISIDTYLNNPNTPTIKKFFTGF